MTNEEFAAFSCGRAQLVFVPEEHETKRSAKRIGEAS
jgi:hypothetical protein